MAKEKNNTTLIILVLLVLGFLFFKNRKSGKTGGGILNIFGNDRDVDPSVCEEIKSLKDVACAKDPANNNHPTQDGDCDYNGVSGHVIPSIQKVIRKAWHEDNTNFGVGVDPALKGDFKLVYYCCNQSFANSVPSQGFKIQWVGINDPYFKDPYDYLADHDIRPYYSMDGNYISNYMQGGNADPSAKLIDSTKDRLVPMRTLSHSPNSAFAGQTYPARIMDICYLRQNGEQICDIVENYNQYFFTHPNYNDPNKIVEIKIEFTYIVNGWQKTYTKTFYPDWDYCSNLGYTL